MSTETFGARVARLRGALSQQALAALMVEAGHDKWSQATVWSTEKDSRRLRFTEAIDMARIIGVSLEELATGELTEAAVAARDLSDLKARIDCAIEALTGHTYEELGL